MDDVWRRKAADLGLDQADERRVQLGGGRLRLVQHRHVRVDGLALDGVRHAGAARRASRSRCVCVSPGGGGHGAVVCVCACGHEHAAAQQLLLPFDAITSMRCKAALRAPVPLPRRAARQLTR
jgi:hypothetical protein